jgi:hypothetical protein
MLKVSACEIYIWLALKLGWHTKIESAKKISNGYYKKPLPKIKIQNFDNHFTNGFFLKIVIKNRYSNYFERKKLLLKIDTVTVFC